MAGSLKSTPNDRFFEKLFMAILFTSQSFARNLLRGNRRRKILFVFCFDVWPGARTMAFRLISQHTTYQTTATSYLIFLQKIIYTAQPTYLYGTINFGRSARGLILIQRKYKTAFSECQFFIYCTRLWNQLPKRIQIISNGNRFKIELLSHFR